MQTYTLTYPAINAVEPTVPSLSDRRQGTSDLEKASETLNHAVRHLFFEQLHRHRSSVQSHRDAIAILVKAAQELARQERRAPIRKSIASWLRGSVVVN